MKKSLYTIGAIMMVLTITSGTLIFNFFEKVEGRGPIQKQNVHKAFQTGQLFEDGLDFLLTQSIDQITKQPMMRVNARYWKDHVGYIEFFSFEDINQTKKCSFAVIDGFALKCVSPNFPKGFFVCTNTFLHSSNITDKNISAKYYLNNLSKISKHFSSLPKDIHNSITFEENDVPRPLQMQFDGVDAPNYGSPISCWNEQFTANIARPKTFDCDKEKYARCESSFPQNN